MLHGILVILALVAYISVYVVFCYFCQENIVAKYWLSMKRLKSEVPQSLPRLSFDLYEINHQGSSILFKKELQHLGSG